MKMVQLFGLCIMGVLVVKVNTTLREIRFITSFFESSSMSVTSVHSSSLLDINSHYQCARACSFDPMCTRFEFCLNNPLEKCTLYQSGSTCYEESNEKTNAGCKCFRMELMRYEDGTCRCPVGYHGHGQQCCQHVIEDCTEGFLIETLKEREGVITFIKPVSYIEEPFEVVCDFVWGGFTVIQKRRSVNDAVDFNRNWLEYRNGFGTLHADYWLGLEKMYHILQNYGPNNHRLNIHMFDRFYSHCMWYSDSFNIEDESLNYTATFGNILLAADLNDWCDGMFNSLTPDSKPFSTYDHIGYPNTFNCTDREESGWWFADDIKCSFSNLNLKRVDGDIVVKTPSGILIAPSVTMQISRL